MMTTRNSPLRINELSRITRTLFRQHHHGVGLFVLIATLFVLSFLAGLQPPMQFRVFMAGEVADSDVVAHRSLTVEDFKKIAVLMLQEYVGSLKEKGISFTWDDKAVSWLAEHAFGKRSGARDLRNLIRREVEDRIASVLVEHCDSNVTAIAVTVGDDGALTLQTLL